MSRPMTMQELGDLLRHIRDHHSPLQSNLGVKTIKYCHPSIDFRTTTCFAIVFRGFGPSVTLYTQNECRDLPDSLYDRCIAFLNDPTWPKECE